MIRKPKGFPDRLSPNSPEYALRQARNGHNACFGGVAMAKAWMINIHQRRTTTSEAKATAVAVENLLDLLQEQLKTRVDNDTQKGIAT